jgi:hypothetical protein
MTQSDTTNKGGRPATGKDPLISARVPPATIGAIDTWAGNNGVTRSEAIRRLVELGLTVKPRSAPTERLRAARGSERASKAIDRITPGGANMDEQATRKRRLLKGPEEFREVRVDRAKK